MEKDYVHTTLFDSVPVPDDFTGNNYSPFVGYEGTNSISNTSHTNGPTSTKFQSWAAPMTTNNTNRHNIDRNYEPMDGRHKTTSVSKVIDDHPYRPNFTKELFGVLTENEKLQRKMLTGLLWQEKNNNLLRMLTDQPTIVSPFFLPSPNQLNKIKANLKKDATAMDEVTKLYKSTSVVGVPTREPTMGELTRLKFALIRIKERNIDYNHYEFASVWYICSTLHQIASSIKNEITKVLKIQIFKYFMSVTKYLQFPHYGGKDVTFLLERSQTYDCIKKLSRKSAVVLCLLKECAVTVKHKFEVKQNSALLIDWVMEGRNLIVNRDFLAEYLNDFRHELFTMSWKPIMLFKLERVCSNNDTLTETRPAGNQQRTSEQVTNAMNAELLLQMNRGRSIPRFNCTTEFGVVPRNTGDQSLTPTGQISHVSVTGTVPGTLLDNSSSISNNPSGSSLQMTKNTAAEMSNEQMLTTGISSRPVVGTIIDLSQNSMINAPAVNNKTPNENSIKEKEQNNNSPPPVPAIQQKEKPMMKPNIGPSVQQETLVSTITANLSVGANKSLSPKGHAKEQEQRTMSLLPGKRVFKQGEDPRSMILQHSESSGGREKGQSHSFFCPQKQHKPKKIGDGHSTICTADDMLVVNNKSDMKFYNLTHQTCSEKSEKCIFTMDKYSRYTDWSKIPCSNVWYCNMCAILRREEKYKHVIITSMCSFCKQICQEKEDNDMPKSNNESKRSRRRRCSNI